MTSASRIQPLPRVCLFDAYIVACGLLSRLDNYASSNANELDAWHSSGSSVQLPQGGYTVHSELRGPVKSTYRFVEESMTSSTAIYVSAEVLRVQLFEADTIHIYKFG